MSSTDTDNKSFFSHLKTFGRQHNRLYHIDDPTDYIESDRKAGERMKKSLKSFFSQLKTFGRRHNRLYYINDPTDYIESERKVGERLLNC